MVFAPARHAGLPLGWTLVDGVGSVMFGTVWAFVGVGERVSVICGSGVAPAVTAWFGMHFVDFFWY